MTPSHSHDTCPLYVQALTQITDATLRDVDAEATQVCRVLTEALAAWRTTHGLSALGLTVGLHRFVTQIEAALPVDLTHALPSATAPDSVAAHTAPSPRGPE